MITGDHSQRPQFVGGHVQPIADGLPVVERLGRARAGHDDGLAADRLVQVDRLLQALRGEHGIAVVG